MTQKYHIIINQSSGTVLKMGVDKLRDIIEESNISYASLNFVDAENLTDIIEDIIDGDDNHPLLIGGGDGTQRGVAEIIMHTKRKMGVLPLGTMNLVAHDMNVPLDIKDALEAYSGDTHVAKMDVGYLNDKIFLCCVATGSIAEATQLREEKRSSSTPALFAQLGLFLLDHLDKKNWHSVHLRIDRKRYKFKASALIISNNIYKPAKSVNDINNMRRAHLDKNIMGVLSAKPYNTWDKVRFLFKIRLGNWRKDPVIRIWKGSTIMLDIVSKSKKNTLTLDGEILDVEAPYHFSLDPKALSLVMPSPKL